MNRGIPVIPSQRVAAIIFAALLVVSSLIQSSGGYAVSAQTAQSSPVECAGDAALATYIDRAVSDGSAVYGVVVAHPDGKVVYTRNAETPFVAASLYKLVLMADVEALIESKAIDPLAPMALDPVWYEDLPDDDDAYYHYWIDGRFTSVQEAMLATGAFSSNVGAHALMSVTSPESLARTAISLGMSMTHFKAWLQDLEQWPPAAGRDVPAGDFERSLQFIDGEAAGDQVNLTTPADVARFFSLLLEGKVVSERASTEILNILGQQQIRDRFPALLPDGAKVAHKTGNLEGVVHDAGIIATPRGPMIVVAMTQDAWDDQAASTVLQQIAQLVYNDVPPVTDGDCYGA